MINVFRRAGCPQPAVFQTICTYLTVGWLIVHNYVNFPFSIIHSQLFNPKNPISIDAIIRLRLFCCKIDNFMLIFS